MTITKLAELPGLTRHRELDTTLTLRLSAEDRARLDRTAEALGVPVGRLIRAVVRRALEETTI